MYSVTVTSCYCAWTLAEMENKAQNLTVSSIRVMLNLMLYACIFFVFIVVNVRCLHLFKDRFIPAEEICDIFLFPFCLSPWSRAVQRHQRNVSTLIHQGHLLLSCDRMSKRITSSRTRKGTLPIRPTRSYGCSSTNYETGNVFAKMRTTRLLKWAISPQQVLQNFRKCKSDTCNDALCVDKILVTGSIGLRSSGFGNEH